MAPASRLRRHQERESKRQIYIYLAIIIALIILMLTFGSRIIEFIGNAAYLVRGEEEQTERQSVSVVQPPLLEVLPEATSESTLPVAGSVVAEGGTVELFVNDEKVDSQRLREELDFSFDIELSEGENVIRTRYTLNEETSEYSESQTVVYTDEAPKLEEISPSDGQEFKRGDQRIEVRGKTDPEIIVTINGFRAVVEKDGEFSYFLRLNEGDNKVEIVAKNKAGLETKKEITVKYSP